MLRRVIPGATAAGALLFLATCSDQRQPTGPSEDPSGPDLTPFQGSPEDPVALARAVPGFGGFFLDARGNPTMYLKDPGQRARAEQALAPYLRAHRFRRGSAQGPQGRL
jgi:hypothetical protein